MMVRTILAVRAFGIVEKKGDAVFRRSTTSVNLDERRSPRYTREHRGRLLRRYRAAMGSAFLRPSHGRFTLSEGIATNSSRYTSASGFSERCARRLVTVITTHALHRSMPFHYPHLCLE